MPVSKAPPTILMSWLRASTTEEKLQLAAKANTTKGYLYQLATCARGSRISASMALAIEDAAAEMHITSAGRLPKITVRDLVTMCDLQLFGTD